MVDRKECYEGLRVLNEEEGLLGVLGLVRLDRVLVLVLIVVTWIVIHIRNTTRGSVRYCRSKFTIDVTNHGP